MKHKLYNKVVAYITENQEKFYRLAFSYVQNKDDALDVVQNAICSALDHYNTLRNEEALKTWFYRILVNESLLLIKRRNKELLAGEDIQLDTPYYEKGYEKDDELSCQINRLDPETQSIIKLRFFEELSLAEISRIMEMNLNTVKAKLSSGLKQLTQNLEVGA